jgi:hypothetical protein
MIEGYITTKKPFHPSRDEKVDNLFVVPPSFRISSADEKDTLGPTANVVETCTLLAEYRLDEGYSFLADQEHFQPLVHLLCLPMGRNMARLNVILIYWMIEAMIA